MGKQGAARFLSDRCATNQLWTRLDWAGLQNYADLRSGKLPAPLCRPPPEATRWLRSKMVPMLFVCLLEGVLEQRPFCGVSQVLRPASLSSSIVVCSYIALNASLCRESRPQVLVDFVRARVFARSLLAYCRVVGWLVVVPILVGPFLFIR